MEISPIVDELPKILSTKQQILINKFSKLTLTEVNFNSPKLAAVFLVEFAFGVAAAEKTVDCYRQFFEHLTVVIGALLSDPQIPDRKVIDLLSRLMS